MHRSNGAIQLIENLFILVLADKAAAISLHDFMKGLQLKMD
jgi:hypothetical protein